MALHSYNNIDVFVTSFPALCMFFLGICPRTQIHLEPPYFRRVNMGRYHPFCKNMACLQCLVWKQFVYTLLSLGKQRVMLARLFFILKLDFCLQPTWGNERTEDFFWPIGQGFWQWGLGYTTLASKKYQGISVAFVVSICDRGTDSDKVVFEFPSLCQNLSMSKR